MWDWYRILCVRLWFDVKARRNRLHMPQHISESMPARTSCCLLLGGLSTSQGQCVSPALQQSGQGRVRAAQAMQQMMEQAQKGGGAPGGAP